MENEWKKIGVYELPGFDFITHLNYVSFLNELSKEIKIFINFNIKTISKEKYKDQLKKKVNLVGAIKRNLEEEYRISKEDREFAKIVCAWVPVKIYYLIYNLWLIFLCLLNDDEKNLFLGHKPVIRNIKNLLRDKKISFSIDEFNNIFPIKILDQYKLEFGEHIKPELPKEKKIGYISRKIAKYQLDDFKRDNNISDFRTKKAREKRKNFWKGQTVSLFENFYWYRIKANYRDIDFLNQDIFEQHFLDFFKNYLDWGMNFYSALKEVINEISSKRMGEKII